MAAIVYHGLQSHLETNIVESRTLRLRLPSPKPIPSQSIDLSFKSCFWDSNSNTNTKTNQEENKTNTSGCGWSFLDALSNISHSQGTTTSQKETTYVHPNQKRSSLVLSPKSLEICTENLGNESGTDIVENGIEMLSSTSNKGCWNFETREQRQEPSQHVVTKKAKTQSFNFPPPLTTIRGSESLRVRPHREGGRLVIEVTKVPPTSCFQVERSHGRLRLGFLTNNTTTFEPQEEEEDVEEVEDISDESKPISKDEFDEEFYDNKMNAQLQYAEEDDNDGEEKETEEETEEEAEEEEEEESVEMMRMEKEERRRMCKEGGENENNELLKWGEPLWVATS